MRSAQRIKGVNQCETCVGPGVITVANVSDAFAASVYCQLPQLQDEMAVAAAQYEDRIRIAEVEGAAIARLLREKWRTEFDKRKRLHNLVRV